MGIQSSFTNTSIFDRPYYEALFGGSTFPDGSFMIDAEEDVIEFQKLFMEVMSECRSHNMMTFPVNTISLLRQNGKFVDEDFAKWACKHNMKWCDSNFFVDDTVNSLSNCCFDGEQKCLTKSSNGVYYSTFKELYESDYKLRKNNLTIFHNGSWVSGKIIKTNKKQMYKIITSNKKELLVTSDHIFPTLEGDKQTIDLSIDDYLMFNCRHLDTYCEKDKGLTYEQGYLIGMYLGDGSIYHHKENETPTIHLSLNQKKYNASINIIEKAIKQIDENAIYRLNEPYNNVYPTNIRSWAIRNFIKEFTSGNYNYEKELNLDCLLQSREFRKGILDGYYITDGGNNNRIYTTSPKLCEQTEVLLTSLGLNSIIDVSDRTDEKIIIRDKCYNRNHKLYCIRWYTPKNKRTNKLSKFKVKNNSEYYKIKSIEKYESNDEYVYCFEMENQDEPYFTLPNGVITHNCRLKSNIADMGFFNSIGGTALQVGSTKVSTVNLARLALENSTEEEYLKALKDIAILDFKVLDRVRHIIKRNVEKNLLRNFSHGLVNFKNLYNTMGSRE